MWGPRHVVPARRNTPRSRSCRGGPLRPPRRCGLALTFKADTTGVTKGRADTAVRPYKLPELPNSDWSESTVGGRHHLPSLGTRVRVRGGGVGRVLTPGRGLGGRSQLGDRAAVSRVGASARGSAAGAGPGASFRPRNAICLEQIRGHAARKRREDLDEPQGHSRPTTPLRRAS